MSEKLFLLIPCPLRFNTDAVPDSAETAVTVLSPCLVKFPMILQNTIANINNMLADTNKYLLLLNLLFILFRTSFVYFVAQRDLFKQIILYALSLHNTKSIVSSLQFLPHCKYLLN